MLHVSDLESFFTKACIYLGHEPERHDKFQVQGAQCSRGGKERTQKNSHVISCIFHHCLQKRVEVIREND